MGLGEGEGDYPAPRAALAIPMTGPDGTEGVPVLVLALYRYEAEAFDNADLAALCVVCRSAGLRQGRGRHWIVQERPFWGRARF